MSVGARKLALTHRHFGTNARSSEVSSDDDRKNSDVQISICNYTNRTIFSKNRTGFSAVTHYSQNSRDRRSPKVERSHVEIIYSLFIPDAAKTMAMAHYERQSSYSALAEAIYDVLRYKVSRRDYSSFIDVVIRIPEEDLHCNDGAIYLEDLDLVIGIGTGEGIDHPESPEVRNRRDNSRLVRDIGDLDDRTLIIAIEAVDHSGDRKYEDRYISICGLIYKVPVKQDALAKRSGVYIRRKPSLDEVRQGKDSSILHEFYMTFEEAEDMIGLCRTTEAASGRGDSKLAIENKLQEQMRLNKELDLELAKIKKEAELEANEHKRAIEQMKQEAELRATQAAKDKIEADRQQRAEEDRRAREKAEREEQAAKEKHDREMNKIKSTGFFDTVKGIVTVLGMFAGAVAVLTKPIKPI